MKTLIGKTKFLSYLFAQNFWFSLGGPASWDDENDPTSAVNSTTLITNPFVFMEVTSPKFCKIDVNGELAYGSIKLTEVLEADWYTNYPDHIFLEVEINDSIVSYTDEWRETGLSINTLRATTVPSTQTVLYPNLNEVQDYGTLLSYENHTKRTIIPGETRKVLGLLEI